jgi:hypothetical protein
MSEEVRSAGHCSRRVRRREERDASTAIANTNARPSGLPERQRSEIVQPPPFTPLPMSLAPAGRGSVPRSACVRQEQAPETQAANDEQSASSQGDPSGTGSPAQCPAASQRAFCVHESGIWQGVPAGAVDASQSPLVGLHSDTPQGPLGVHVFGVPTH